MDIREYIQSHILILDGGMGTMLQRAGLEAGGLPEVYNVEHPEIVQEIHRAYVEAGANVVTANTFQANALKLKDCGYSPEELITAGVRLAKESGADYVALDIGPLGQLMHPMGTMTFEMAYDLFKQQVVAGAEAGADLILLETMSDLLEVKAGVLAAKEHSDLPVFVSMTYQADGRTFVGVDPVSAAVTLSGLRVDALGVNCSLGPRELGPVVSELLTYARVPVLVQPNAGLPRMEGERPVYDVSPEEYAEFMGELAERGAAVLGGCCGTSPEYIQKLTQQLGDRKRRAVPSRRVSAVCSGSCTVSLDDGLTVIGERINPTGREDLQESLRAQDFEDIVDEAMEQSQSGADLLDVNCGLPEMDETPLLRRAVEEIQAVVRTPLVIDSADPAAVEQAVRIYNGKPVINSVNGKQESLDAILPIAARYGAVVVGLTMDEDGIPDTAQKRFAIAERIVREAEKYGIPREDILIDCLALTASAQQELVMETLCAIQLVKARLGVKTVLGVSNVSHGLPDRPLLNSVFLAAGFGAGLDAAIINPLSDEEMKTVRALRVLNHQDQAAAEYIADYRG